MISVIVPTFNRGHLIAQTIDSVLSQSCADFELIIVDDHSTDSTEEIVKNYVKNDERVIYIKRPSHYKKGANSCRNFGFEISKGTYVKWLDSDDLLAPNALEIQLESLSNNTDMDLSICNTEVFFDADFSNPSHIWGNIQTEACVSNFLLATFRWHTSAGFWRKSYFSNVPPWKEGLMNSQEWLMHLSQLIRKVNLIKVSQTLCLVRAHQGSMSHKNNKSANYYYNECLARFFAFKLILNVSIEVSNSAKKKIIQQFLIYHFFTVYKGSIFLFFKLFKFYPVLILFQISRKV